MTDPLIIIPLSKLFGRGYDEMSSRTQKLVRQAYGCSLVSFHTLFKEGNMVQLIFPMVLNTTIITSTETCTQKEIKLSTLMQDSQYAEIFLEFLFKPESVLTVCQIN